MNVSADDIKKRISEIASHFTFEFKELRCGIDPLSPTDFDMWCGDDGCKVNSIDEVMTTPFFQGKTLDQISGDIEIIDW